MSDQLVRHASGTAPVWIRLSAFLALKSPETRRTYAGIVSEWCRFLGAEPGSDAAAQKLVAVTDLHAAAYRRWLEARPGEQPRTDGQRKSTSTAIAEISRASINQKKRGLESTQSNATIHKKFAAREEFYGIGYRTPRCLGIQTIQELSERTTERPGQKTLEQRVAVN